jgi:hypothetical protein
MTMRDPAIPQFNPAHDGSRWVAYFDLLGMRARIQSGGHFEVFDAYQQVIERLERDKVAHSRVNITWFSDTFLLATTDDSGPSFCELEQVCRWLMYFMLQARVPLRGAISCGPMYADFAHRIFIGQAMIEAYDYGEGQDWVGLLICPSAAATMQRLGIPVENRLNYALWEPVWKREPAGAPGRIGACLLGAWGSINGKNMCVEAMTQLAAHSPAKDRAKYERAIQFIASNPRLLVVDGPSQAAHQPPLAHEAE